MSRWPTINILANKKNLCNQPLLSNGGKGTFFSKFTQIIAAGSVSFCKFAIHNIII